MPVYSFENKTTGELSDHWLKMSEYDEFVATNPHLSRVYAGVGPAVSESAAMSGKKPDEGFRDVLRSLKKANRNLLSGGCSINTF